MSSDRSIEFFDRQFERQVQQPDVGLNPFKQAALPYLRGRVLDYGCGMGQLSIAAARAGCPVIALDASEVAIDHLRRIAEAERLPVKADVADLRIHRLDQDFDTIVSIGMLMFFDCATAEAALARTRGAPAARRHLDRQCAGRRARPTWTCSIRRDTASSSGTP